MSAFGAWSLSLEGRARNGLVDPMFHMMGPPPGEFRPSELHRSSGMQGRDMRQRLCGSEYLYRALI